MGKHKKTRRTPNKRRRTFKRSKIPPTRANIFGGGIKMKGGSGGGVVFPASSSSTHPQSYLPYNDFSNDPNYLGVSARNTGPFLTGVMKGGRSRRKIKGGGNDVSLNISNAMNSFTNGSGIMSTGVAKVMGAFSGNESAYYSTPAKVAPLA